MNHEEEDMSARKKASAEMEMTIRLPEPELSLEEQDELKRHLSSQVRAVIEHWKEGPDISLARSQVSMEIGEPKIQSVK